MTATSPKRIRKLTAGDPETQSADIVAENIARLKALFPELVTEAGQTHMEDSQARACQSPKQTSWPHFSTSLADSPHCARTCFFRSPVRLADSICVCPGDRG